jgi:hypothetical protein
MVLSLYLLHRKTWLKMCVLKANVIGLLGLGTALTLALSQRERGLDVEAAVQMPPQ